MHKELENYLAHLYPVFSQAGIQVQEQKELLYGVQLRLSKNMYKSVLNIYYSAKNGISSVTGGQSNPLKNLIQDLIDGTTSEEQQSAGFHSWNAWIGADECGKGDYFGAPVVCAFAYQESMATDFKQMGVKDSKLIKDYEICTIAKKLYAKYPKHIACIVIKPAKYNDLIASFKLQNLNLNDLLAWLHSTNITNLQKNSPNSQGVLVDQFSPSQKVRRTLQEKHFPLPCIERTGAESDPAVAAASIIGRYQFVEAFSAMRQFYQIDFPKGATSAVIKSATEFCQKYGFKRLGEVAKLHFKTTSQVQAKLNH
ncbi:MAG: ribonuclease HIII [Candidatus Cloacimonetes bacterium]|nr:ribonuclease HIII [Candidatus Cloacimonadota bacterium]